MDNGWVQAIVGGLISILLFEAGKRTFSRDFPVALALFAVCVSAVIFMMGMILEPASYALLAGQDVEWTIMMWFRKTYPRTLVLAIFTLGLFPGLLTGLMLIRADSLLRRIGYGVFWAPMSLSIFDAIWYSVMYQQLTEDQRVVLGVSVNRLMFSMFSNVVGGVVGGIAIGLAVHLFVQLAYKGTVPRRSASKHRRASALE